MNELKIFENPDFGEVRTMEIDGEPYFVGKDVAEILGYSNPQKAIREHVDDDDKGGERNGHPWGGTTACMYQRKRALQPYPLQQAPKGKGV